jgi:hypothetical protein
VGDLIRFVDSIAASPTTRLDLNDEASWWVRKFDAPPPRLRRSMASNAMRDGIHVGSTSYDSRTLVIELECLKSTQDEAATQLQLLARELDRANNWLQYQPNGLTKPVFFRTFRSDASQIADVVAQAAMREFTIEVLAEPFALGLPETLGPYTINNNPAAGSNPCYVDLPTILGDVAAPMTYWDEAASGHLKRTIVMASGTSVPALAWVQAEDTTNVSYGADTSNPGGAANAAMSGSGSTNYVRTTFAGTTSSPARVQWDDVAAAGRHRVIAFARGAGSTGVNKVWCSLLRSATYLQTGNKTEISQDTVRRALDLGVFDWPNDAASGVGIVPPGTDRNVYFGAERVSGSATLEWDAFVLLPAGGQVGLVVSTLMTSMLTQYLVLDGENDAAYSAASAGDPTAGAIQLEQSQVTGALPSVHPNKSNRLHVVSSSAQDYCLVGSSTTVNLAYWPRYVMVRPVST